MGQAYRSSTRLSISERMIQIPQVVLDMGCYSIKISNQTIGHEQPMSAHIVELTDRIISQKVDGWMCLSTILKYFERKIII